MSKRLDYMSDVTIYKNGQVEIITKQAILKRGNIKFEQKKECPCYSCLDQQAFKCNDCRPYREYITNQERSKERPKNPLPYSPDYKTFIYDRQTIAKYKKLTSKDKAIIALYYAEFPQSEIARLLNITRDKVRWICDKFK